MPIPCGIRSTPSARAESPTGSAIRPTRCRTVREVLRLVERHLAEHRWLAQGEQPSIADVALYPYLALAPEGGLALDHYPALNAWIARIRALPGYIPMPGL